jgi:hypothetical protein
MLEVSRLGISRRAVAALAPSFGLCAMLALAVPGAAAAGDNEIVDALRGWRARNGRPRRHFPGSG